jgi:hypothetical protein
MKYEVTNNDFRHKAFKTMDRGVVLVEPGATETVLVGEPIRGSEGLEFKLLDADAGDATEPDLSILDSSVADMKAKLDALDLGHLKALRAAETAGKNRQSALAAIDEAVAAKPAV